MIDNLNKMISCASNIIICCIIIMQKKESISNSFREHGMHSNQYRILLKTETQKDTLGLTQINKYWYHGIVIGMDINNHPKNKTSNSNLYGDIHDLMKKMYGIWSSLYALYMDNLCMEF
eukprot:509944_1